jgi:hypothetical protein
MKIRRLQIETHQMARISVKAQLARLNINAPMRRIKAVQQQRAQMTVKREDPSLKVNMESLRNNTGLKSLGTLRREFSSQALAQAKEGIKTIENNGDFIAAQPRQGNPIAQLARNAIVRAKPTPPPRGASDPTVSVTGNPGSLSIDWSVQDVSITWDDYQAPLITIEPKPSVDVVLVQEPQLTFRVVEHTFPPESGRTIDKEV